MAFHRNKPIGSHYFQLPCQHSLIPTSAVSMVTVALDCYCSVGTCNSLQAMVAKGAGVISSTGSIRNDCVKPEHLKLLTRCGFSKKHLQNDLILESRVKVRIDLFISFPSSETLLKDSFRWCESKHDFLRLKHQSYAVILDLRLKTLFFAKHILNTSMQIVIKSCTLPEYTIISL